MELRDGRGIGTSCMDLRDARGRRFMDFLDGIASVPLYEMNARSLWSSHITCTFTRYRQLAF